MPIRVVYFSGLSRSAAIICPSVALSLLGRTVGLAAASTARTASRYAPQEVLAASGRQVATRDNAQLRTPTLTLGGTRLAQEDRSGYSAGE